MVGIVEGVVVGVVEGVVEGVGHALRGVLPGCPRVEELVAQAGTLIVAGRDRVTRTVALLPERWSTCV